MLEPLRRLLAMVIVAQETSGTSEDEGNRSPRAGMGFAACSATMRLAMREAVDASARKLPASQLNGESAFGAASSARTARTTLTKVQAGLQASFRMSKQTSPVRREYSGETVASSLLLQAARAVAHADIEFEFEDAALEGRVRGAGDPRPPRL